METTEKIQTIIETITGINDVTIIKREEAGRIITPQEVEDYETWEASDLKQQLYTQLGKLYYEQATQE